MNNIPQAIQELSISLQCLGFLVLYPMFVPGLLQAQTAAPEEKVGEEYPRQPLLTLKMEDFMDCSYWHYSTVQLQLASKDICYIWMHKQALMLVETTRSISLFADMWAWNNMT